MGVEAGQAPGCDDQKTSRHATNEGRSSAGGRALHCTMHSNRARPDNMLHQEWIGQENV